MVQSFAMWSSQKRQHAKKKTPSPGELTLLIIRFSLLKVGWDRNTESQTQEIMSVKLSCPNKHGRAPSDFTQSVLNLQKLELDLWVSSTKPPNPDPEVPSKPRHQPCAFCHWHGHINIQRMECCSQSTWVMKCTLTGKVRAWEPVLHFYCTWGGDMGGWRTDCCQ